MCYVPRVVPDGKRRMIPADGLPTRAVRMAVSLEHTVVAAVVAAYRLATPGLPPGRGREALDTTQYDLEACSLRTRRGYGILQKRLKRDLRPNTHHCTLTRSITFKSQVPNLL